jgi:hypothetical protein
MNSTLRWFLISLAALLTISFGSYYGLQRHWSDSDFLLLDAWTLATYAIIAASWRAVGLSKLSVSLIAVVCTGPVLVGMVWTFVNPGTVRDAPYVLNGKLNEVLFAVTFVAVMVLAIWIAARPEPPGRARIGWIAGIGCLLVLVSLFAPITLSENYGHGAVGWRVLDRQVHWVTAYASVGQSAAFGGTIKWLQPIFQVTGYAFYACTIVATLAMFVILIALRFSSSRLAVSVTFARLTAVLSLASAWVLEDIHWGWHFDFSSQAFAACVATAFWVSMIVFSGIVVGRMARGDRSSSLISWLRLVQIPMIAFNLMLLREYFSRDEYVPFTGLAALLVGLPVLSWSCQQILLANRPEPAMMPVDGTNPGNHLFPTLTAS